MSDDILGNTLTAYAGSGAVAMLFVLLGMSVVALAITIERGLQRRRDRTDPELLESLARPQGAWHADAIGWLRSARGAEARVLNEGLAVGEQHGVQAAEEALAAGLLRLRLDLSRNLTLLGSIGSNAPFVGLLGTVLGILRAFTDLSLKADGGPERVMAGISAALASTAVGLAVAIPSVLLFNLFTRRNEVIVESTTALAHQVVRQLRARVEYPQTSGRAHDGHR